MMEDIPFGQIIIYRGMKTLLLTSDDILLLRTGEEIKSVADEIKALENPYNINASGSRYKVFNDFINNLDKFDIGYIIVITSFHQHHLPPVLRPYLNERKNCFCGLVNKERGKT